MDLLLDVAIEIRSAVLPHLGRAATRGTEGTAVGGDPTFGIDEFAEAAANEVLEAAARSTNGLAWYTEDRGLVERGKPERMLIIDPIDGTRPAGAGMEAGMVSIAAAPFDLEATLADVDEGLVMSIKTGTLFRAKRGKGVRIIERGETRQPTLSELTTIEGSFWTYGLRGRPAIPSAIVLEELIDTSATSGGAFDIGSATFGMTSVVTGNLDAYVDHGQRLIDELPETRPLFEEVAGGAILNNNPYDIAAAKIVCEEAGCVVSDAAGKSLDDRRLVGSGPDYCLSAVVSATRELHDEIIATLDRGMDKLRDHLARVGAC